MAKRRRPPYRIETERLVVRCWETDDAALLKEAVDSSLDHLRPWMPWALDEPQTLEQKVELLQRFRHHFERGDDFPYAIFTADESEVVGGTGLHTRPAGAAYELGYWIRASRVRNGLVTEACAALTKVGFELCRVKRLVIRIEPGNEASLGVPPKLGYQATGSERSTDGRDLRVFTLTASDYATSPSTQVEVRAYDAGGSRLL